MANSEQVERSEIPAWHYSRAGGLVRPDGKPIGEYPFEDELKMLVVVRHYYEDKVPAWHYLRGGGIITAKLPDLDTTRG